MTYESTQKSTCTTCTIKGDNSNYWVPKLYYQAQNGSFKDVPVKGGTVYYQQRAKFGNAKLRAFPPGFRMLAGSPGLRTLDPNSPAQKAVSHVCLNYKGKAPVPEDRPLPPVPCPDGIRSQIYFPSCWDGVNLDSADHKSHMAYPSGVDHGDCPATHPVPLVSIFYEFIFDTSKFQWYDPNKQPFVYAMGDPTGYGFHGDFLNGWDEQILQNGIDKKTTIDFGAVNDVTFEGIFEYPAIYGDQCQLPPVVQEPVTGWLDSLPGCNPVTMTSTKGPCNKAIPAMGVDTSGIFTDVTSSLGFKYLGCGTDQYGNNALPTKVADNDAMTVESCIKACEARGFSIAGLEYARQCFCGNSLPASAQPTPGVIGDCTMPCTGNANQKCGAGNRLSLYEKCTGASCENAQFGLVGAPGMGYTPGTPGTGSSPAPGSGSTSSGSPAPYSPPQSAASPASTPGAGSNPNPPQEPVPQEPVGECPAPVRITVYVPAPTVTEVAAPGSDLSTANSDSSQSEKSNDAPGTGDKDHTSTSAGAGAGSTGGSGGSVTTVTVSPLPVVTSTTTSSSAPFPIGNSTTSAGPTGTGNAAQSTASSTTLISVTTSTTSDSSTTTTTTTTTTSSTTSSTPSATPSSHLPPMYSPLGCWRDAYNDRSLRGINLAYWGVPITTTNCAQHCYDNGFALAGTEFGEQCFCGMMLVGNTTYVDDAECNMPCAGDATQICGGPDRLTLVGVYYHLGGRGRPGTLGGPPLKVSSTTAAAPAASPVKRAATHARREAHIRRHGHGRRAHAHGDF
jgi:hypothetical protein